MNPTMDTQPGRRHFLRTTGAALALPLLESRPATGSIQEQVSVSPVADASRLVCIGAYLGAHQPAFFPEQQGADYELTPLLKPLAELRSDFTVFSGLDHRASNGHNNWPTFLCGKNVGGISLDQLAAGQLPSNCRFGSLQLSAGKYSKNMNYTAEGAPLPMIERPSVVYRRLFGSEEERLRTEQRLRSGLSVLDHLTQDTRLLAQQVSAQDRTRLDEYFTSLRSVENRMQRHLKGLDAPVPPVDYQLPDYDPVAPTLMLECESIMYDLMALAIQTDSTRVATLFIGGLGQVFTLDGKTLQAGYHALSHHGNDPDKIRDLIRVETEHMKCLAEFLGTLKKKRDSDGRSLLDSTLVLWGTGMGDASRHANDNLPTLLAGGGLNHGRHLAINPKDAKTSSPLLGDLYLTMLHQLGIEAESFSNASRNMDDFLCG